MNKTISIILGAIIIGAGVFYFLSMKPVDMSEVDMSTSTNTNEDYNSNPVIFNSTTTVTTTNTLILASSSPSSSKTYNVSIKEWAFSPKTTTIKVGDTIVWKNNDGMVHTVTSDSGTELASPYINKNGSYSHTFTKAGTFDYHCIPHPNMKGKVVVR